MRYLFLCALIIACVHENVRVVDPKRGRSFRVDEPVAKPVQERQTIRRLGPGGMRLYNEYCPAHKKDRNRSVAVGIERPLSGGREGSHLFSSLECESFEP